MPFKWILFRLLAISYDIVVSENIFRKWQIVHGLLRLVVFIPQGFCMHSLMFIGNFSANHLSVSIIYYAVITQTANSKLPAATTTIVVNTNFSRLAFINNNNNYL